MNRNNRTDNTMSHHQSSSTLTSFHQDFVHDIAFDHYGRRIATCSGDRTVKVWDLDEKGEWTFQPGSGSDWHAHRGSVTRLSWAHPEFGQLLATCGSDHTACVWEERDVSFSFPVHEQNTSDNNNNNITNSKRWVEKTKLTEAKKAVHCVQFAPRHLGLKLATGSADGSVRIYEAIDVMNLNQWRMNESIEVALDAGSGSNISNNQHQQQQHRPHRQHHHGDGEDFDVELQELGVTSLGWCRGRFEPPTLVVAAGRKVSVYKYSDASRHWSRILDLPAHSKGVLDVSWAPNVGRSFHLIASAGSDHVLKVHRLAIRKGTSSSGTSGGEGSSLEQKSLDHESTQVLDTGTNVVVWRCAWNVTGTVLASSGDRGIVQLWKCHFRDGTWKCVSEVHGDVASEQPMKVAV